MQELITEWCFRLDASDSRHSLSISRSLQSPRAAASLQLAGVPFKLTDHLSIYLSIYILIADNIRLYMITKPASFASSAASPHTHHSLPSTTQGH
jgi:hypothetical protein